MLGVGLQQQLLLLLIGDARGLQQSSAADWTAWRRSQTRS
jgi:hypothetical protein